jgi:hypothetical protein
LKACIYSIQNILLRNDPKARILSREGGDKGGNERKRRIKSIKRKIKSDLNRMEKRDQDLEKIRKRKIVVLHFLGVLKKEEI